jgi:uncharacterized membrane-anchored protein YitT (DUF2179 family)
LRNRGNYDLKKVKEFLLINLGLILVALGITLFKIPNNFATGGVSGIAIIVYKYFPTAPVGLLMLLINIILIVISLIIIGSDFGSKTIYSSFALSGLVWLFQKLIPLSKPLTGDAFIELIFAIGLPAIGSAIIFNLGASTGGTDIVARILNKYTHLNIGKTLLISDFIIAVSAGIIFGVRAGMYSVLGLVLKAFIIDLVIESLNIGKQIVIVSSKSEEIANFIISDLKRGATIHKGVGAYSGDEKNVITTVMNRKQAVRLGIFIKGIDERAFLTISNTSEIIGKGFRNTGL